MAAVNKVGLVAVPVGIALVFVAGRFFVDVNRSYTFLIVPAVTLAVVLVTFLPQVRSGLQRRRLLVGGIPAEATVLDAAQTGTTMAIGAQQQFGVLLTLEVRAQGRAPYATRTEAFISMLQVPQVQPGAVVPVRIDPQDQTKVALDLGAGLTSPFSQAGAPYAAGRQEAMRMLQQLEARDSEVRARGESALAKILRAQPSGISVNGGNPLMNLEVEVYPAARPPFQSAAQTAVAASAVGKFQPGMTVWVKFDPSDTSRVTVERSA